MTSTTKRRAQLLEEMGIGPVWTLRDELRPAASAVPLPAGTEPDIAQPVVAQAASVTPAPAAHVQDKDLGWGDIDPPMAPMPPYFDGQDDPFGSMEPMLPEESFSDSTAPGNARIAQMNWQELKEAVSVCTRCRLCETRTHAVFGAGTPKANWLFVGEGPGYNEDLQGEPFIGPAGKLLDNMMAAMGLKRGVNAYIANIVKCRATDANGRDRPPTPEESAACMPYLERQIELIRPNVIVALGKTAALSLLGRDPATPVGNLRGTVHRYGEIPLVVTYHPAYLLRKLDDKSKAWRDLCLAMTSYADLARAD